MAVDSVPTVESPFGVGHKIVDNDLEQMFVCAVVSDPRLLAEVPDVGVIDMHDLVARQAFTAVRNLEATDQAITVESVVAELEKMHGVETNGAAAVRAMLRTPVTDSIDASAIRKLGDQVMLTAARREQAIRDDEKRTREDDEIADQALRDCEPDEPKPEQKPTITLKATVRLSADRPAIVDFAERILGQDGGVFVRARRLVHIVRDAGASGWRSRQREQQRDPLAASDGSPIIVPVERDHLLERLARKAEWVTQKDGNAKRAPVPNWVATMLMARGQWSLPQLETISDAPVFRPDGSIHDLPGYDSQTRVFFDPRGVRFPSPPAAPSRQDAVDSISVLLEPFSEFPFVDSSDKAAVAAFILSIVGRAAIDGSVPMFSSQAPTPGSGKGLLVDAVSMIATGRRAPLMAPTDDDEEIRKRLLAIAVESPALVCIDNVEGSIGSPPLAMAITAGEVSDRVLGSTRMASASLRPVWSITGNNVQLKGDLGRRVVPIDLDPRCEHPEDRKFQRGDLIEHISSRRPQLIVAALTILRAFVVAGCPQHDQTAKGSFEQWDRLVRAAVIWSYGVDPLGGVTRIRSQADEDLERLRTLLVAWHDRFGTVSRTLGDAVRLAGDSGELRDAFAAYCRGGKPDTRQIGFALRKVRGRVVGGFVMHRDENLDRDGLARWVVYRTSEDGAK